MILLQFIVGIAFLILIHELGHYIAARLANIEIEEFGIGFPPRIKELFEYKGTKFTLNWIPLGGFVRPKGENDPEIEGGLAAASPGARLFVLLAGPAMNLLAGVIIFAIIFMRIGGPDESQVIILKIDPESPAEISGLLAGDVITAVNQNDISGMEMLSAAIQSNLDETIDISVLRGDDTLFLSAVPSSSRPSGKGALGIIMGNPTKQLNIAEAASAGGFAVYRSVQIILSLPGQMMSGTAQPEEVRIVGYKGMFDVLANMNERDAIAPDEIAGVNTLSFFASITVSLGLLNLMPFPALDGGRILFIIPEVLFRRRVPAKLENAVHLLGFAFLLMVLVYVNLQDFINPISIPSP